jgi:putative hydrolase of the HAD superfamily
MIKNLIFDLGNVLISFKPSEFFSQKNYPENIKTTILADIFASREWHMLDNGDINTRQAIDSIALRSSLNKDEIAHIFNLRTQIMFPLDLNVRLLPELKKQGLRLYYLSNFPIDIFEEIKNGYYFFKYFDGGIISAEVNHSKPTSRIYEILIEQYSLIPEECLYIDDLEINVKGAEAVGMNGLITYGSADISKEISAILDSSNGREDL